jgi:hypothetical protein
MAGRRGWIVCFLRVVCCAAGCVLSHRNFHFVVSASFCARSDLEIKVVVIAATGVKSAVAMRTLIIAIEIFLDAKFRFTDTAKNSLPVPFALRPALHRMPRGFFVAMDTGVIFVAAFETNGDNIQRRVVVDAARLLVHKSAFYYGHRLHHLYRQISAGLVNYFFFIQA